jgi:hypothetical protein
MRQRSSVPANVKAAYEERVRALEAAISERDRRLKVLAQVAARVHAEDDERKILEIGLDEILGLLTKKTSSSTSPRRAGCPPSTSTTCGATAWRNASARRCSGRATACWPATPRSARACRTSSRA